LDVEDAALYFGPGEALVRRAGFAEAEAGVGFFGGSEEFGGLDGVGEENGGADAYEDG
jgi:hypothetical protein